MKTAKFLSSLAIGLLLAACGGGGNNTTLTQPPGGGGGGSTVASVTLSSSLTSIAADGSTKATITAIVRDANNASVQSATVVFGSSNGLLAVVSGTTDASGTATATLTAPPAPAGTAIKVTAAVGTVAATPVTVNVVAIQQSLSLVTDMPQIPSDFSKSATISALMRDANNVALPGIVVNFQTSGGTLTVTQGTTDANGIAKATLSAFNDPTDRRITVTATAGSAQPATVAVDVTGTTLSLTGPANLVLNNVGTYTIQLNNSTPKGIANTPVTVTSANGNTLNGTALSTATVTTNATGQATVTLKATSAANNGNDTLTANALGLVATAPIAVSSQSFNITAPADGTQVPLGNVQTVTVTWTNSGAAVANAPVTFAATRGTLVTVPAGGTVNTNTSGVATATISSTGAGPSIVSATGAGVSAQLNLNFVSIVPSQISLQAGPATVPVGGKSVITALVRDAANNLVDNATVNFNVVTDPTNGGLSVASAMTNVQGQAQTTYTAGNTSSGANGVQISATVFYQGTAVATATTNLTVGGQTVFLSLGTGNTIDTGQGVAVYQVTYTVFAVDSNGSALANQPVTVSVLPVAYGKGVMGNCNPGSGPWLPVYSTLAADPDAYPGTKLCKNEDFDYTGNINSQPNKDYNGNGKLDPGNVAVVTPSSGSTDANGRLDVLVTYPRDHAGWVEVQLVASTTVQGTQSSTSATFLLQGAAPDYSSCTIGPPGPVSPYGKANTCLNPL
jgi:hypothetical protein